MDKKEFKRIAMNILFGILAIIAGAIAIWMGGFQ